MSFNAASKKLTINQTAEVLQCSTDTVRRLIAKGQLKAYRYGSRIIRIDPLDLDRMRKPVTSLAAIVEMDDELAGGAA